MQKFQLSGTLYPLLVVRFLAAFLDQIDAILDHELCDSFFYYREVANPFSHTYFFFFFVPSKFVLRNGGNPLLRSLLSAVEGQAPIVLELKGNRHLKSKAIHHGALIPLINQIRASKASLSFFLVQRGLLFSAVDSHFFYLFTPLPT